MHELNVFVNGTTTNITTTTLYLGAAVYESKTYSTPPRDYANYSNQLQFAGHEEGRLRAVRTNPQDNLTQLVYDYMLIDVEIVPIPSESGWINEHITACW